MKYTSKLAIILFLSTLITVIYYFAFVYVGYTDPLSANKDIMEHKIEFYPKDGKEGKANPIILSFRGKVCDETENWWFESVANERLKLTDAEKFITSVVSMNQEGSEQDVLGLWNPKEREEIKSMIFNRELFDKNRNFYRGIRHSAFVAEVYYGSYILFFIQHSSDFFGSFIKVYPITTTDDSYFLTNQLQSDPLFQYLSSAYAKALPIRKQP